VPGAGHRASRTPTQDTSAIEGLAAEIDATEGHLDILVNNADTTRVILHADLRALDDDFFDFVLAVNLAGPFATVRACRPLLEATGQGLSGGASGSKPIARRSRRQSRRPGSLDRYRDYADRADPAKLATRRIRSPTYPLKEHRNVRDADLWPLCRSSL
jgi:NAD(P)-dependent dehydrogenase (short-subunit alcohol dehydrogenase family)